MKQRRLIVCDELLHGLTKTLSQTGQQVERDDDEGAIRFLVVVLIGLELLILRKGTCDNRQTPLINREGVFGEGTGSSNRD